MMAKPKVEGPYRVVKMENGEWKIMRVAGRYPSLESVEQRRVDEERAHAWNLEHGRPARPLRDEAYWERERVHAGQEIMRDIDGGKHYAHRQAAYRRSVELNRQWQDQQHEKEGVSMGTTVKFVIGTRGLETSVDEVYTEEEWYNTDDLPSNTNWEHVEVEDDQAMSAYIAAQNRFLHAAWTPNQDYEAREENAQIMEKAQQEMKRLRKN